MYQSAWIVVNFTCGQVDNQEQPSPVGAFELVVYIVEFGVTLASVYFTVHCV